MSLGCFYLHNATTATLSFSLATADLASVDAAGRAAVILKPATRKLEGALDGASLAAFASKVLGREVAVAQVAQDVWIVDAPAGKAPAKK